MMGVIVLPLSCNGSKASNQNRNWCTRRSQLSVEHADSGIAGYVRFRNFLLYGEWNLAGETVLVDIFQDVLTLDYHQERLSRYSVEWQPDDKHLRRVGSPRLYQHRYQSAQLELWQPGEVEWFVIIRDSPKSHRRKLKGHILVLQLPLLLDGTEG